jgi:hypothetical protein
MDEIEIGVLLACQEYGRRQKEMLPFLAAAIGVPESEVFYAKMRRPFVQRGTLMDGEWLYFFHGHECDLRNQTDGRFLRVDFGPKGRVGILNDYGVLRLIMTSVPPWREFAKLRTFFANEGPPFHENSGAWEKLLPIWDRLEKQGFFEQADPSLVDLQAQYTTRGNDGLDHVNYPPDVSHETRADCSVAHRQQLSRKALDLLNTLALNGTAGADSPKVHTAAT